ncbi:hypothetical protein GQF03_04040 [Sneathiella chungangensis]|uniref:Uncharacterized protein n=1 Tax=Sneathiella chungangensis TaxID=1418234 RepID=A0A845MCS2_9PROT|nr:hypothetical protein [Sneathiella chungangensis]MZR21492.1 hypothetical protein [Sneathiella chungangensis]
MKKLIITTMALALLAGPAFAFGGSDISGQNHVHIGGAFGSITNGGDSSATYGSSNIGGVAALTVINDDVRAPVIFGLPSSGEFSYTGVSNTAIGANTYYAENFSGGIQTGVPADGAVEDSPSPNGWGWGDFLR